MKLIKALSLLVITAACAVSLYFAWPRLSRDFPALKKVEAQIKSIGDSSPSSSGNQGSDRLVIINTTPDQDLTPDQAKWLDLKRRRHQLLTEAVAKQ